MNTVLSLIVLLQQNSLEKSSNCILANYIINHINEMENIGIKEIANKCHISTSTILRFCKLLGFDTYQEFKNQLISTAKTRVIQLEEKSQTIQINELINQIDNISKSEFDRNQFISQIDQIIYEINQYKIIHLYGATFPLALSQSFVEDMALLGIMVNIHQSGYGVEEVKNEEGVHIIISYSGRFIDINGNKYRKIIGMNHPTIVISRVKENIEDIDYFVKLPNTQNSNDDDIVLLLIYNLILIKCYKNIP